MVYQTPSAKDVLSLKVLNVSIPVGRILPVLLCRNTTNERTTVVHRVGKVAGLAEAVEYLNNARPVASDIPVRRTALK